MAELKWESSHLQWQYKMQHANEKVALCIKRMKLLRNSINCEHQKYVLNVTVLQGRLSQSGVGILNREQQWLWLCGLLACPDLQCIVVTR